MVVQKMFEARLLAVIQGGNCSMVLEPVEINLILSDDCTVQAKNIYFLFSHLVVTTLETFYSLPLMDTPQHAKLKRFLRMIALS